jgi:hypothetical protein
MKLQDLAEALPHGFHNAILLSIDVRYDEQQLELWLGVLDKDGVESRRMTVGILVEGLLYVVIEPPHPNYFDDAVEDGISEPMVGTSMAHQWADAESITAKLLNLPLASNAFRFRLLVHNWNAYIHIAATSARFLTAVQIR